MQSFLSKVVAEVLDFNTPLSKITFVLPNKRSGLFLKNILKNKLSKSTFLPKILSIEEFIKEVSGYEILDNVSLLFEFYGVYKAHTRSDQADSFESFSKWAPILIQDFNDLDSNLFDAESIFSYIHDSKRLEQWDLGDQQQSDMLQNYLGFFDKMKTYHKELVRHLKNKKLGYQGLVYKTATEKISPFIQGNQDSKFIFAGFNALNKSEENIIQELLHNKLARIYWDHDEFYDKSNNQAGQFFKKYASSWPYYHNHDFQWKKSNLNRLKTIHLHGLPKNITQIKHVGTILKELYKSNRIEETAVILGNEKLLPSLLNSIPKEITKTNITMGYELQNVSLTSFFESVFKLYLNKTKWKKNHSFYYKDLVSVINDPFFQTFWVQNNSFETKLKTLLFKDKSIFVTENELIELVSESAVLSELFSLLFLNWDTNIENIITKFILIIDLLRKAHDQNNLYQEFLYRFYNIFIQLSNLNKEFGFIENLNTLHQVFQQILSLEKLSFEGEPLQGLQIMGLLESRVLDFKHIIITSVNEGFLPATGSNNSFIPMDIKIEKKIPAFFERDAIFSYHFFRLFHRAENVYLLYNNISDDFGAGEPSRFIRQLDIAKKLDLLNQVTIERKVINPKLSPEPFTLIQIKKNNDILSKLKELAIKGFSPTSLGNYIRNPLDFYKKSILGIKEFEELQETIDAKTFGTIIHDSLEKLYQPYIDRFINKEAIQEMKKRLHSEITAQFVKSYSSKSIASGKNYLSFEIAKQFVLNFLNFETSELNKGKNIKILGLEVPIFYEHHVSGLDFGIKIKGKIDRIDEVDGIRRIIDYKTGKVEPGQLKINDWSLLISDEKYSKSFQVLTYAYMYKMNHPDKFKSQPLESGIVSFKNLKFGFMKLNASYIADDTIDAYVTQLNGLLKEIFDKNIPLTEKEIPVFSF